MIQYDNKGYTIKKIDRIDFEELINYFSNLSADTKSRFGPHAFNINTVRELFNNSKNHIGYIVQENHSHKIIAYSIIKIGYLNHDKPRLESYGLQLSSVTDCTFAPSVADHWQGRGIGKNMFQFILSDLKTRGFKRIILWGGVQDNNERAVKYYQNLNFNVLGSFEHQGQNYDMAYQIP